MFNVLNKIILFFTLTFWLDGNSQQSALVIKNVEYVWVRDFGGFSGGPISRVIIPSNDSISLLLGKSFARAIHDRWNITMPETSLTVRPLPVLANTPKFKTVLKDKEPGKWYLFLQVFDRGRSPGPFDEKHTAASILELRGRIISGTNDSLILDRELTVKLFNELSSPDQVPLKRLAAYPASFVKGFDSISKWLFQPEPFNQVSLMLRPACVFRETVIKDTPLSQLKFKSENQDIYLLTEPAFSFHTPAPTYERTEPKKNRGGHFAGGALTALTGIGTSKNKVFKCKADFPFEGRDSIYHCVVGYTEEQTADRERTRNEDGSFSISSSGYRLFGRNTDSSYLNVITVLGDTMATFSISNSKGEEGKNNHTLMWDGIDSSTIMPLPPDWSNSEEETNILIRGKTRDYSFTMKSSGDSRIKEFFINDQLVTIVHGKNEPVRAFIFHPVTTRDLKLFTILSSLPYSYFFASHPD
jgi:hypothetical protein